MQIFLTSFCLPNPLKSMLDPADFFSIKFCLCEDFFKIEDLENWSCFIAVGHIFEIGTRCQESWFC